MAKGMATHYVVRASWSGYVAEIGHTQKKWHSTHQKVESAWIHRNINAIYRQQAQYTWHVFHIHQMHISNHGIAFLAQFPPLSTTPLWTSNKKYVELSTVREPRISKYLQLCCQQLKRNIWNSAQLQSLECPHVFTTPLNYYWVWIKGYSRSFKDQ